MTTEEGTRYEVSAIIGPCTEEQAEALIDAILALPEATSVGAAVGCRPFTEEDSL